MNLPDPCPMCHKKKPESVGMYDGSCIHCGAEMQDFVGGPLDGSHPIHPTMNSILTMPGHDGKYMFFVGKYRWVPNT